MSLIRVILIGIGPIGFACARAVRADRAMDLVGLVDTDENKIGKTLDELGGRTDSTVAGPKVTGDLGEALKTDADVAIITTSSQFDKVYPTIRKCIERGLAVVSSCEQMIWPWYRHASLADQLDAAAKHANCAVLGTGVNPGFVMDSLAVSLSTMVRRVDSIRCVRKVDASLRRGSLQMKIGATLKREQFEDLAKARQIGHQGIGESVAMLGAGLGVHVEPGSVHETLEPVIAEKAIPSALGLIEPGAVCGIHNIAKWEGDGPRIELDLTMAVGQTNAMDKIIVQGPVQLHIKIPGAIPGDSATVGVMVNHVRIVANARPGLLTMLDVPIAGCRGRD